MGERKINDSIMLAMLNKGKKQKDVARFFGVSPQAISDRMKHLQGGVTKIVTLERGNEIVEQKLNTIEQLHHINDVANKLLDELTGEDHIIDNIVQAVEAFQAFQEKPTPCKAKDLRNIIKKIISEKNIAIKACAEIRAQLSLQLEIYKTLYDMKAVQEFQEEVLNTIAEVNQEVRNEIIKRLKQRRALRQSASLH